MSVDELKTEILRLNPEARHLSPGNTGQFGWDERV
jgi:hypothetical protein